MALVLAFTAFFAGCIPCVFLGGLMKRVLFWDNYILSLVRNNQMSRANAEKIWSKHKRESWLLAAAIVAFLVAGLLLAPKSAYGIVFLMGQVFSLVGSALQYEVSGSDIRVFAKKHIAELLKSGWWESEDEAITDLVYNYEMSEKIKSEGGLWWPGRK